MVVVERSAEPTSYEGANNSDDDVYDNAEGAAVDDTTGQCAGDTSDNQRKNDSMRDGVQVSSPITPDHVSGEQAFQ